MSIIEKRIDLLRDQNRRLNSLLSDPQPGPWMAMVPQVIDEMNAIMEGKRD